MRGFWLESLNMSFNWKYHPNLIHLHDFQLLVLLPFVIEIAFFSNKVNFLCLRPSLDRLVIAAKEFLSLPNISVLIKKGV